MIHVSESWRSAYGQPDRRAIYEWSAANVTLPRVLTRTGRFSVAESRHFMAPLDALKSDLVREVNICAPVRSGKTLIADLAVAWTIPNDPASVLWVFDTDASAKLHCELRLMPLLERVPQVVAMMPADRHQARTQEILFANGLPLIVAGPAMSNLQARGYRMVIADEVWNWPAGRLEEAKARMGDFVKMASNKFLAISQGGADGDEWHGQYLSGETNEWHVQCAACGKYQMPVWTGKRPDNTRWGLIYDAEERKDGSYDLDKAAATARFRCFHCGHEHSDSQRTRSDWNRHGEYRVSGDSVKARKSFHWTALIDTPWDALVVDWLKARHQAHQGFYLPTVQFTQKRLAQWATETSVIEGLNPVTRVEYDVSTEWPDEDCRFGTIDVQGEDVYYLMIRAWSKSGESRRLYWGKLHGSAAVAEVLAEHKVPAHRTLCDTGHMKESGSALERVIYREVARYEWIGTKGDDATSFTHSVIEKGVRRYVSKPWSATFWGDPERGTEGAGRKASLARCLRFSVPVIGDRFAGLMEQGLFREPHAEGLSDDEREYQDQLRAEIKVAEKDQKTGRLKRYWRRIRRDNHALDCARLQTLAAMMKCIL